MSEHYNAEIFVPRTQDTKMNQFSSELFTEDSRELWQQNEERDSSSEEILPPVVLFDSAAPVETDSAQPDGAPRSRRPPAVSEPSTIFNPEDRESAPRSVATEYAQAHEQSAPRSVRQATQYVQAQAEGDPRSVRRAAGYAEAQPRSSILLPPEAAAAGAILDVGMELEREPEEMSTFGFWQHQIRETANATIESVVERRDFLDALEAFQSLASETGLPEEEVVSVLQQTEKLLGSEEEGAVSRDDRVLAARSLAAHLAYPSSIDQGSNGTCSVTAIAERLLWRNPAAVAEMVTTAAIEGEWRARDGKVIELDDSAFRPGDEERVFPPPEGSADRSFAAQILNHVMVNDVLQRDLTPTIYFQDREPDGGERVRMRDQDPSTAAEFRGIGVSGMQDILNRLTGDELTVIAHTDFAAHDNVASISDQQDLMSWLEDARTSNNLPMIVTVDANHLVFGGLNTPEEVGSWHVVSVTEFDPATSMVRISNQWGSSSDKYMDVADLYGATRRSHPLNS